MPKNIIKNTVLTVFGLLLLLTACSEDEGPASHVHYYNPVWSSDDKTVVFAVYEESESGSMPAVERQSKFMTVYDVETRSSRRVNFNVDNTILREYTFDLGNDILAFIEDGIKFLTLDGTLQGVFAGSADGIEPVAMQFTNTGNSFIWAGSKGGRVLVEEIKFDRSDWSIVEEIVLLDEQLDTDVLALTITTQQATFALRLASGEIREYTLAGDLRNIYTYEPYTSENPRHYRMVAYKTVTGTKRLYALEHQGLLLLNLAEGTSKRLVSGNIRDFDVSERGGIMVYETYSGDTWLATDQGTPLNRLAPHNVMPRMSFAGSWLAASGTVDQFTDTLTVFQYRD